MFRAVVIHSCSMDAFRQFLASHSSLNVSPHIKDLTLRSFHATHEASELTALELCLILDSLPVLETLKLSYLTWGSSSRIMPPETWPHPRSLKKLSLQDIRIEAFRSLTSFECGFTELLNLFGHVQTFHLSDVQFVNDETHGVHGSHESLATAAGANISNVFCIDNLISDAFILTQRMGWRSSPNRAAWMHYGT